MSQTKARGDARLREMLRDAVYGWASVPDRSLSRRAVVNVLRDLLDVSARKHDPRCYQNRSIPDALPVDACDCLVWRMSDRHAGDMRGDE